VPDCCIGPITVPVLESGTLPLHDPVPEQEVAPVVDQLALAVSPTLSVVGLMTNTADGLAALTTPPVAPAVEPLLAEQPNSAAAAVTRINARRKPLCPIVMMYSRSAFTAIKC
jgi:hypothetical protein